MFGSAFSARRPAAAVVAATVLLAGMAVVAPASAAPAQTGPPPQVLERDMRGEAAISALGSRLPEVAALNDMTPDEFRAALREDSMLWVSRSGRLLFVDEFVASDDAAMNHEVLDPASVPTDADVFDLHSRPGAERVIVLDFDGHDATGTAWEDEGTTAQAAPFSKDTEPGFSPEEKAVIYSVWQRVAEDYAPFDIDVTTDAPVHSPTSPAPIVHRSSQSDSQFGTRVVVTPSETYTCNCGGVAYVGVYDETGSTHSYYQPAWVFAGTTASAKTIAEAASHEAGHNLGLSHDGTRKTGYYAGHGDWAPIMGVGYYEPITQWSRGEYSGANNREDDFGTIQANGGPLAVDDRASTQSLAIGGSTDGVIERATDTDSFSVTADAPGTLVIAARPATVSPNLDIGLTVGGLTSGFGTSALDASISVPMTAGQVVTAVVDGVGFGTADTGYTGYGSVGRYRISASFTPDAGGGGGTVIPDQPSAPAAPAEFSATATGSTVTLAWSDVAGEDGFELERTYTHPRNGRVQTTTWTLPADTSSYQDLNLSAADYTYEIRAFNAAGESDPVAATATVSGGSGGGGGKPAKVR